MNKPKQTHNKQQTQIERPPYITKPIAYVDWQSRPLLKSKEELDSMRKVTVIGRKILDFAGTLVKPGVTTDEIDKLIHEAIISENAYPSPLGYKGL